MYCILNYLYMYCVVSCVYSCIILQVSITQFHNCMHVCVCVWVCLSVICVCSLSLFTIQIACLHFSFVLSYNITIWVVIFFWEGFGRAAVDGRLGECRVSFRAAHTNVSRLQSFMYIICYKLQSIKLIYVYVLEPKRINKWIR